MKGLLIIDDPLVRDQVRAGLNHCPGIEVSVLESDDSFERVRQNWDWIWVGMEKETSVQLLNDVRDSNKDALLVILCEPSVRKRLEANLEHWKVSSVLRLPVQPLDLFRLVGRLRSRHVVHGEI